MKFDWKFIAVGVILLVVVVGGIIWLKSQKVPTSQPSPVKQSSPAATTQNQTKMKLTSIAFENNQSIPAKYTCDGQNFNPPLVIAEVPDNSQSLVLIMDDPDAPAGTWVHWTVWNVDPNTREIAQNSVPFGSIEGVTSFGKPGYGGPCPPSGTHHYYFKLYALDTKLDLSTTTTAKDLEKAMEGHVLAKTELIGLYQRK